MGNEGYPSSHLSKLIRSEMVTIKMLRTSGEYKEGKRYEVTNNIAHGLIDSGLAILHREKKIMRPQSTKMRYRTK